MVEIKEGDAWKEINFDEKFMEIRNLLLSAVFGFILWKTENKKEATHIVINEFYEGNDKPRWVELYNPPDEKINVTYWRFYVNWAYGPFIPGNWGWHYIYPHEYVLIGNSRSTLEKY